MTPAQQKVLDLLTEHRHGLRAIDIAEMLWPDSPGWSKGERANAAMSRPAKAILTRLIRAGHVVVRKDTANGLTQNRVYVGVK